VARLLLLALLLLATALQATNAVNDIGVGAKAKGMGGVGVALPQDALVVAVNPAGLAILSNRLDIGAGWVWQNGGSTVGDTHYRSHQTVWFPEVGLSWRFCPRQALGLAVWVNGTLFTHYPTSNPTLGTTPVRFNFSQAKIAASWGWQINQVHSVGVAANWLIGWLEANGLQLIAQQSAFPNDATNDGIAYQPGYSFHVGWLATFCDLKVGASFQTRSWLGRFFRYQGLIWRGGRIDLAPMLSVGASYEWGWWTFAADLVYRFWSDIPAFERPLQGGGLFGSAGGPGFGWNDQGIVRLGASWEVGPQLALRFGYNYGYTPFGRSQTLLNQLTLATTNHHVTAGGSWRWMCNEVTIYIYRAFRGRVKGAVEVANSQFSAGFSYGRKY